MARILVTADDARETFLDEKYVRPVHLESEQSAKQLLDRIGWAIRDAEGRLTRKIRATKGKDSGP